MIGFNRTLVKMGYHGRRHRISRIILNIHAYLEKQHGRLARLLDWMDRNGK